MSNIESVRRFSQVDVFVSGAKHGNPVAVVHDADAVSSDQMQRFANWTNLSETTFLLAPTDSSADYRLRIFTPRGELPFAGHPTLGSAHAWLERGGIPHQDGLIVQECGAGPVEVRHDGTRLRFHAPPLIRSGPLEPEILDQAVAGLGIDVAEVVRSNWVDNGPGWVGIHLASARRVLELRPDFSVMGDLNVGVIGAYGAGGPVDFEVRAFAPGEGVDEDPVTGSVNASLAQWLHGEGVVEGNYTVQQGTVLGRGGFVTVTCDADGIWVGGSTRTIISGDVVLAEPVIE